MAPGLALEMLSDCERSLRVLDPMCGSGTVIAVAQANGHQAIGIDIDPLAVLISKVWTTPIDPDSINATSLTVLENARGALDKATLLQTYPKNSDHETRDFIDFWFDEKSRCQLASLAWAIDEVKDETIRDVLWCAFSRLIITKSSGVSLAMDLSHSRPHRVYERAPVNPFDKFAKAAERVAKNCVNIDLWTNRPNPRVTEGDARALEIKDSSIDLVLTSPPYLNAIDYIRCSKFSLAWMGYRTANARELRSKLVGAEIGRGVDNDVEIRTVLNQLDLKPQLAARQHSILVRYIADMRHVVRETARVLVKHGRAVFVIGDNTIRGTVIRNSLIIRSVAELSGLTLIRQRVRELPANRRYLPPPTRRSKLAPLSKRMRREVVMSFEKAT